jgi:hypothetical protein
VDCLAKANAKIFRKYCYPKFSNAGIKSMRLKFYLQSTLKFVSRIDPEKTESYSGSHLVIFPAS